MALIKSVLSFEEVELWLPLAGNSFLVSGELVKIEDTAEDYVVGYEWQELSAKYLDDDLKEHEVPDLLLSFLVPGTANRGGCQAKEMSLEDFIQDEILYLEAEGKLPSTWEE